MSSATLLGGLVSLFASSAKLTTDFAASNGLWVGGVPEAYDTLPYVVLIQHDEVPKEFFPGSVTNDAKFDLVVYGIGLAATESLARDIKATFDPSSTPGSGQKASAPVKLDLANCANNWILRTGYRVSAYEYRAADSSWVYEITLPYKAFVEWLT